MVGIFGIEGAELVLTLGATFEGGEFDVAWPFGAATLTTEAATELTIEVI